MNRDVRERALDTGLPLMDFILMRIKKLKEETGISRTIFAVCPNSVSVIKTALKAAKRWNAPVKFAATLNQVDIDGGYTGLTQTEFVNTIRQFARSIHLEVPVIIAIDHGGPWLKDRHVIEKWSYEDTMAAVKKSFEEAIMAGYDLIHIDPTVDITLPKGKQIAIGTVVDRTVDLLLHAENFREANGYPKIAYEVGTEEVHGGLADLATFTRFLDLLKKRLKEVQMEHVWPCFVVGKVGTDLHTTDFDPEIAGKLAEIAAQYGSVIKGHYTDNVKNPQAYPLSGMGGANVGPEFTEREYDALLELERIHDSLSFEGKIGRQVHMKELLSKAVVDSGRWRKWMQPDEDRENFYANPPNRQEWLIKTGCRYIWEKPEIVAARYRLFENLKLQGIDAGSIVEAYIGRAMDKYFSAFNLVDLNSLL
ncbi:MAG TPA: class II D-tagatose-bisphosphate aldolase, non-catalytic subunit [Bacteroidales bacterium]|nr:class II D-tagatose-bisphosphate aldolase, non-catalytic subunit [Bacteroidales bacterium]